MDQRLRRILEATEALGRGQFSVEFPVGDDDVGRLGYALRGLAESMDQRFRELRTLSKVTEQINAGLVLDDVLDSVFESFRPIIPYHRIGFALLEQDDTVVRARWARSDSKEVRLGLNFNLPMERTSLGKVLASGKPRILNDLEAYLQEHPDSLSTRLIVEEGMRSSLTCPLIAMGRPIGFIFFSCMQKEGYRDVHVEIFREIAGQLSVIVEKSRLYQRLLELNEVKNRFLGIAAHDLRNPIGVIQGYLHLILNGLVGDVPDRQRRLLEKVERSCQKMHDLVNDLLDLSAIEAGQLNLEAEPVELGPYVSELAETHSLLAAAKGIRLETDLPDDLPTVRLDRRRFEQVLDNLITNAVKFSYPGTVIHVGAEQVGTRVRLFVRDQGQGIPPEEVGRLFQDFARGTSKPTAGESSTGLGLAISRRIVEAHGGTIGVQSQPGRGATFTITLPRGTPLFQV